MRPLGGTSWERCGSGAVVNHGTGSLYFNEDMLCRLEFHQGNPDAIAELIAEARRPKIPQKKTSSSRKPGYGRKQFRR